LNFSTRPLLAYGGRHYHVHSPDASTLLLKLIWGIQEEAGVMSSALEEFARETMDELAKKLPLEKRLELLREIPLDKRLEVLNELPLEKRLEVLKGLSGEQIRRVVPVEKLLEGLSPGERADLAKKLLANGSGPTSH
jgi:Mg/Co/Ni transporter MgtE